MSRPERPDLEAHARLSARLPKTEHRQSDRAPVSQRGVPLVEPQTRRGSPVRVAVRGVTHPSKSAACRVLRVSLQELELMLRDGRAALVDESPTDQSTTEEGATE